MRHISVDRASRKWPYRHGDPLRNYLRPRILVQSFRTRLFPLATGGEITGLLAALRRGDSKAKSDLADLVYAELRALARIHMGRERPGHTLQPTALVHETYLRLVRDEGADWQNRAHFYASASLAMRRVLVDHARSRAAAKRPDGRRKVELEEFLTAESPQIDQLLILDEALSRLAGMDARQAGVVEMIFFGGMSHDEVADVLGVSRQDRQARLERCSRLAAGRAKPASTKEAHAASW